MFDGEQGWVPARMEFYTVRTRKPRNRQLRTIMGRDTVAATMVAGLAGRAPQERIGEGVCGVLLFDRATFFVGVAGGVKLKKS